jgi:hypothetical protein
VQPNDYVNAILVPEGGQVPIDIENLSVQGIFHVVSIFILFALIVLIDVKEDEEMFLFFLLFPLSCILSFNYLTQQRAIFLRACSVTLGWTPGTIPSRNDCLICITLISGNNSWPHSTLRARSVKLSRPGTARNNSSPIQFIEWFQAQNNSRPFRAANERALTELALCLVLSGMVTLEAPVPIQPSHYAIKWYSTSYYCLPE